jgi:hypothetical protein
VRHGVGSTLFAQNCRRWCEDVLVGAPRLRPAWGPLAAIVAGLASSTARASDRVDVVVTESVQGDGNDAADPPGTASPPGSMVSTRTVRVIERGPPTTEMTWVGLSVGVPVTPMSRTGALPADRLWSNRMRACSHRHQEFCTAMRGIDVRVQFFHTEGEHAYPRSVMYVRTGYETGEAGIEPKADDGYASGEATALVYSSIPVFIGTNVYVIKNFPVRPFVGGGLGVDVQRLRYARRDAARVRHVGARFGMEVHGGIETRLGNRFAITAEVRQQWTHRSKIAGVPGFANIELAVIGALSFAWGTPTWHDAHRIGPAKRITTVTRVTTTLQPPGPRRRQSIFQRRRSVPGAEPPTATPPPVQVDPTKPAAPARKQR